MNENTHYIDYLKEKIASAKSEPERNFYQNRLDVFTGELEKYRLNNQS